MTVAAVLCCALPLLALTCCLPTLRLQGMTLHKLRPFLIPAGALLAIDIPLIALAVRANRARNRAFKPYMDELKGQVDLHYLPKRLPKGPTKAQKAAHKAGALTVLPKGPTKAEKKTYKAGMKAFQNLLLKGLVKPYEAADFRFFLLSELAKGYPKKSRKQEAIHAARDKSLQS